MRVLALVPLALGACSFLIDVPSRLPDGRSRWECARDGSCCPDTTLFPVLDGLAAVPLFVLGLALKSNCDDHGCATSTKVAYEGAPLVGAATLVGAAIYGVHENSRCKDLEREAAKRLAR